MNLNAIHDLLSSHEAIQDKSNIESYKTAKRQTESVLKGSKEERVMFARCQFEHAFAQLYDLLTISYGSCDLRQKQINAFEKALALGENLIDDEEKRDWLYWTGSAYEKLSHATFRRTGVSELSIDAVRKAISYLKRSLDLSKLLYASGSSLVCYWEDIDISFNFQ